MVRPPLLRKLLLTVVCLFAAASSAKADWPEKPITLVVGFGAGGTTDVVARAVGEIVSKKLGQPVVVENRAGAGGAVASTALTKMRPDGYSLVATTSTTITLDPQVSQLGYTLDDFTYVAAVGEFPEAFIALPSKGWKTLNDAVTAAKASGRMSYASNTALDRMIAAAVAKKAGITLAPVPTRGGAEVVTQVMGGHVDLGYSSGAYYPQAKAGEVAVLAVLGERRVAGLPDVPTLLELGYGISSVNAILFVAPKSVPPEIKTKLEGAFAAAAADPAIVDLMEKRSLNAFVQTGGQLEATMRAHAKGYQQLIDAAK